MTNWKRIDSLKEKKAEILADADLDNIRKTKIIKAIEDQIRDEICRGDYCRVKSDHIEPLKFEVWE